MGNVCGCCGGGDQSEKNEYTPLPTTETIRQPDRPTERSQSNFQTILESASSGFLSSKPKYKESFSPDGIDAVRNRIQSARVDLSSFETSPIIIRPSLNGGNGASNNNTVDPDSNGSSGRQNVVRLLSNPVNTVRTKELENRAVGMVDVIRQSEEKIHSYQQENLPLASFGGGSEK